MASNNNNNAALWSNIRKIKKKNTKLFNWIDLLACEIWKCDDKNKPILNKDGKLPESRIDKLEENLGSSDWDTSSEDSLEQELVADIQQLKDDIKRLDARAGYYATKQQLDDLEHTHQTHTHHNPTAQQNETRSEENRARIWDLEQWRQSLGDGFGPIILGDDGPGAGGGKRRKRTRGKKRAKKRRKKKTKKRRRKKKKKTKRRR